jgi:menaquinone-dependent protoporphyrinogen oxidase
MKGLLVVYGTKYGQARLIAERIASAIRARGLQSEMVNSAHPPVPFSFDGYEGAVITASVHFGRHDRKMTKFVRRWRVEPNSLPTLFVSASLSQAGAEDVSARPAQRAQYADDVEKMIVDFALRTGWGPSRVLPVAGTLAYTKYNCVLRLVMKWIAKRVGAATETSKDHEYTDWVTLDKALSEFLEIVQKPECTPVRD